MAFTETFAKEADEQLSATREKTISDLGI